MAGKKGGRSSKTDHVLSLLAGGTTAAEPVREQVRERIKNLCRSYDLEG